jgi:Ca2+/Na+ antiporter
MLALPPGLRHQSPRSATSARRTAAAGDFWDTEAARPDDLDIGFPPELRKGGLLLEMRPLIRDVSFTIIGFGLIFLFGVDGVVSRGEALVLVAGFFVYMAVVFLPAAKQAKKSRSEQASAAAVPGAEDKTTCVHGAVAASPLRRVAVSVTVGTAVVAGANGRDVGNRIDDMSNVGCQHQEVLPTLQVSGSYIAETSGSYGSFGPVTSELETPAASRGICPAPQLSALVEQLRKPIEWVCEHTIPHEPDPGEETTRWLGCFTIGWENNWYVVGFVASLVYVSLLADIILECVKFCGDAIGT